MHSIQCELYHLCRTNLTWLNCQLWNAPYLWHADPDLECWGEAWAFAVGPAEAASETKMRHQLWAGNLATGCLPDWQVRNGFKSCGFNRRNIPLLRPAIFLFGISYTAFVFLIVWPISNLLLVNIALSSRFSIAVNLGKFYHFWPI